jgi:hypothetical protein
MASSILSDTGTFEQMGRSLQRVRDVIKPACVGRRLELQRKGRGRLRSGVCREVAAVLPDRSTSHVAFESSAPRSATGLKGTRARDAALSTSSNLCPTCGGVNGPLAHWWCSGQTTKNRGFAKTPEKRDLRRPARATVRANARPRGDEQEGGHASAVCRAPPRPLRGRQTAGVGNEDHHGR